MKIALQFLVQNKTGNQCCGSYIINVTCYSYKLLNDYEYALNTALTLDNVRYCNITTNRMLVSYCNVMKWHRWFMSKL